MKMFIFGVSGLRIECSQCLGEFYLGGCMATASEVGWGNLVSLLGGWFMGTEKEISKWVNFWRTGKGRGLGTTN